MEAKFEKKLLPLLPHNLWTDRIYAKINFKRRLGYKLSLEQPETFNEKIQWLKLYNRPSHLNVMADKLAVRTIVRDRIGEKYLTKLIGVYGSPDDIEFETLPKRFEMNCTHGSGWNILRDGKGDFDWERCKARLAAWCRTNYYKIGREWVYSNFAPRIICEEYLTDFDGNIPRDYKFFCFHGEPRVVQVDYGRFQAHKRAMFGMNWNMLSFELQYPRPDTVDPQPPNFPEMIEIARH
ncbi:MAG: glycosyl transferase [Chitinivibrionales bacterium]|nr:glycosyl transferase [Chitinivibrionales bacterium]